MNPKLKSPKNRLKSLHELKNFRNSLSNVSDENASQFSVKRAAISNEKMYNPSNTSVFFAFPIKRAYSNVGKMKRIEMMITENDSIINTFIFVLVLFNTIILCLDHYGISEKSWRILQIMDYVCTIGFFIEVIIKIVLVRPRKYFAGNFEKLDCLIIFLNFGQFVFEVYESKMYLYDRGRFEGLKALKILRIFKFVVERNFWASASTLFVEMIIAIFNVRHFIAILSIFLVVTSVMARELMAYKVQITPNGNMDQ